MFYLGHKTQRLGQLASPLWEALNVIFLEQLFDVDYFSCVNADAMACEHYGVQSHLARFHSNGTVVRSRANLQGQFSLWNMLKTVVFCSR